MLNSETKRASSEFSNSIIDWSISENLLEVILMKGNEGKKKGRKNWREGERGGEEKGEGSQKSKKVFYSILSVLRFTHLSDEAAILFAKKKKKKK